MTEPTGPTQQDILTIAQICKRVGWSIVINESSEPVEILVLGSFNNFEEMYQKLYTSKNLVLINPNSFSDFSIN